MITPWYVLIFRGVIFYTVAFTLMRFIGKKLLIKLSPLELILIIFMAQIFQNEIIGNNLSLKSTVIIITTIICLHSTINYLVFRFKWFEKIIIGVPEVIILNGKIHTRILKKQRISESELFEAMREHEIMDIHEVKCAILEIDGKISIIKYEH